MMAGPRVSAWAIRNPIPIALLFVGLTLWGAFAYMGLPVKQLPDTSFPTISVTVAQTGSAPAELETQVARVVENAVASIPGVDHVRSTVTNGLSVTTVDFEIGEDEQRATEQVRSAVDRVRQDLPRGIEEPTVERLDVDAFPVLTYAVSSSGMSDAELSWFVEDTVAKRLQAVTGVGQVARVGGVDRAIDVVLRPDRLAAHGLTASAVNAALRDANLDTSGGRADVGGREQSIRVLGQARDVAALRAFTLPTGDGRHVGLEELADIGDGSEEARGFARLNGRPVVGFQVSKTKAASDVRVDDAVTAEIARLAADHPEVSFDRVVSTAVDTRASFSATVHVLLEGMVLAAVVVFLFLRDWRSTLISAVAMPLSLIPTFIVMSALGFSLNIITLLGLTLVIGILVDDAIVEVENIEKRIEAGQSPFRASMEGADAIGLAVLATTMAIVVVFMPVSALPGIVGQYFREFGITVAVAVLFSLVVARLLTPLLAAYFLKATKHAKPAKPFRGVYRRSLDWALSHRWPAIGAGVAFFIGSVLLAASLPSGFTPTGNPTFFYVNVQGAPGASAEDMEDLVQRVTALARGRDEVDLVFAAVGGPDAAGDLQTGALTIVLNPERRVTTAQTKAALREAFRTVPDALVTLQSENGPADLEVLLVSDDAAALEGAAERVQREMRGFGLLSDIRNSTPPVGPELVITPRPADAARLGVSAASLADTVRVATLGEIEANSARFSDGGRQLPIVVRLPGAARSDLTTLAALRVPTSDGATTLSSVADISFASGPGRIERFDRQRQISVLADLREGATLGDGVKAVERLPSVRSLPEGVSQAQYGSQEAFGELMGAFVGAMLAGVGMIYAVMVLLFRSFFKPITILAALPLSIGGAMAGLWMFDLALTLPALIGVLMLLGLAAKNSILLVEFAIEHERAGYSQRAALIAACRERARPIVMTTIAMAAGMAPTALGVGEGAEFRQPMAIAVIGGLISSTILSLVMVPVVYEVMGDLERWLSPRLARLITAKQPGDDEASRPPASPDADPLTPRP